MNQSPPEFRTTTLYIILACGIMILLMGIALIFLNKTANGMLEPGRHVGRGGPVSLNGVTVIIIGLGLSAFPAYQLIKQRIKGDR